VIHTVQESGITPIIQEVINVPVMPARHARNAVLNFGKFSHNFVLLINIQNSLRSAVARC
jgi:hypothetical protein